MIHIETFVARVRQNDVLWNTKNGNYKSEVMKSAVWTSIGATFGISEQQAAAVFRSLRQKYVREKRKEEANKTANGWTSTYKPWNLLEKLRFLDEVIVPRPRYALYKSLNPSTSSEDSNSSLTSTTLHPYSPSGEILSYADASEMLSLSSNHEIKSELDEEHEFIPMNPEAQPEPEMSTDIEPTQSTSTPVVLNENEEPYTAFCEPPKKRPKRKVDEDVTLNDLLAAIEAPITAQVTTIRQEDVKWNVKEDVKVFCKYLGNRLNKLPDEKRDEFESQILKTLFDLESNLQNND